MNKKWLIAAAVVLILVLIGLVIKMKFLDRQGPGALQIDTTPKALVFLDGSQMGATPFFNDKIEPGEHVVRLVAEGSGEDSASWEGKVNLASGIKVVINRNLTADRSEASGEVLTLEKIDSRDKALLAVVSMPGQAVVKIDGEPKDFTPALFEDLTPGNYQVVISSPGYQEKTIAAKTIAGYKLVIDVQLVKEMEGIEEATESAELEENLTPTPTVKAKTSPVLELEAPYIKIKDTPTGWLRVRSKPSTASEEVGRVNPGETYPYLDEEENGWFKIEYETDKEGWVAGTYVKLVDE